MTISSSRSASTSSSMAWTGSYRPSSPLIVLSPSTTFSTCSSNGTPSSVAPFSSWSRGTCRAKPLSFIFFVDRAEVDLVEAAVRADVRDRDDEAGHLVAGVDDLGEQARARHAGVVAVAEDRLHDVVAIALAPELVRATERMVRRVALVVEVVQEARRAPDLELVAGDPVPVLAVPGDRGLDRQAVAAQRVGLRPLAQEVPGVVARRHGASIRVRRVRRSRPEPRLRWHRLPTMRSRSSRAAAPAGCAALGLRGLRRRCRIASIAPSATVRPTPDASRRGRPVADAGRDRRRVAVRRGDARAPARTRSSRAPAPRIEDADRA